MIFEKSITILSSSNLKRALDYYVNKLGFEEQWEWRDPPPFGGVVKNGVEIFFCENGQGQPGTCLCIVPDNVDACYENIKEKGANMIMPPTSREWNNGGKS